MDSHGESFVQDGKTYYKISFEELGIRLSAFLGEAIPEAILPKVHKYGRSSEGQLNQDRKKYIPKVDLLLDTLIGQPGLSLEDAAAVVHRQPIPLQYFLLERFFFMVETMRQLEEQHGEIELISVPFSLSESPLCLPFPRNMSEEHLLVGHLLPRQMKGSSLRQ